MRICILSLVVALAACCCCSVAKLYMTLCDPMVQHARLLCPPLFSGVGSNSHPLNQWCHTTISSSITPFSSCPQSFPATRYFPVSQLFLSGGQSIGTLASVPSMSIQAWFLLGLTCLISLLSRGLSRVFSSTQFESINSSYAFFICSVIWTLEPQLIRSKKWRGSLGFARDRLRGWRIEQGES